MKNLLRIRHDQIDKYKGTAIHANKLFRSILEKSIDNNPVSVIKIFDYLIFLAGGKLTPEDE